MTVPSSRARAALAGAMSLALVSFAAAQDCAAIWTPEFGAAPGVDGFVRAFAVFDDGSGDGPALYLGGGFSIAGATSATSIARWDGRSWNGLSSGLTSGGIVNALAVFDDGAGGGPALYAAGTFLAVGGQAANRIAKWDGTTWSALSSGLNGEVNALAVFDDGSGDALYAAGAFTTAGGQSASRTAKWDGQSWSALSSGINNAVKALAVFDDGSGGGPALYAGGAFATAGGLSAPHLAKWDGASWSAVAGALDEQVLALTVFDDGSGAGAALYAGGWFLSAGGQSVNGIAKWDGQSWSALGTGFNSAPSALAVFDDGSGGGPALFAGGSFLVAGGQSASGIAKWDGQSWSALGSGLEHFPNPSSGPMVNALAVFDDGFGGGPELYAGGLFGKAGGVNAGRIASWDGESWDVLGTGLNGIVYHLLEYDDGSGGGPALFAAGEFTTAGEEPAGGIAKWNGESWSSVGGGIDGLIPEIYGVHVLAIFDDGSGEALYAGGNFTSIGGVSASNIAKWDGQRWSPLSDGVGNTVLALAVFDDGSGPALYAGGSFLTAGGEPASYIAKWDGQAWSTLSSGTNYWVRALTVFDDGTGPALIAGGGFTSAGGVSGTHLIAKWDGQAWSALQSGLEDGVQALAVFDDGLGGGPALYAASGYPAPDVAKWDGESWSTIGPGLGTGSIRALAALDVEGGGGPALYAGGEVSSLGVNAGIVAKWDGQSWTTLASGIGDDVPVYAVAAFSDGPGAKSLCAGGPFDESASGDSFLAMWGCPIDVVPGCFGNPASLSAVSSAASIGDSFALTLSASSLSSGVGLLFFGLDGTDASGCGFFVPGIGELMLAPVPKPVQAATVPLGAGSASFVLPVPDDPGLVGLDIAFHGAAVGLAPVALELSNALRVTITQ